MKNHLKTVCLALALPVGVFAGGQQVDSLIARTVRVTSAPAASTWSDSFVVMKKGVLSRRNRTQVLTDIAALPLHGTADSSLGSSRLGGLDKSAFALTAHLITTHPDWSTYFDQSYLTTSSPTFAGLAIDAATVSSLLLGSARIEGWSDYVNLTSPSVTYVSANVYMDRSSGFDIWRTITEGPSAIFSVNKTGELQLLRMASQPAETDITPLLLATYPYTVWHSGNLTPAAIGAAEVEHNHTGVYLALHGTADSSGGSARLGGMPASEYALLDSDVYFNQVTTPHLYLYGDIEIRNKTETNRLDFAKRDISGSDAVMNLSSIGTVNGGTPWTGVNLVGTRNEHNHTGVYLALHGTADSSGGSARLGGMPASEYALLDSDVYFNQVTTPHLYLYGDIEIRNKTETNRLDFAKRDISGSDAVMNLSSIGTVNGGTPWTGVNLVGTRNEHNHLDTGSFVAIVEFGNHEKFSIPADYCKYSINGTMCQITFKFPYNVQRDDYEWYFDVVGSDSSNGLLHIIGIDGIPGKCGPAGDPHIMTTMQARSFLHDWHDGAYHDVIEPVTCIIRTFSNQLASIIPYAPWKMKRLVSQTITYSLQ